MWVLVMAGVAVAGIYVAATAMQGGATAAAELIFWMLGAGTIAAIAGLALRR